MGTVRSRFRVFFVLDQVNRGLEGFWRSLLPAGPDLSKGWIAVSFFMRRVSDGWLKSC